MNATVPVGGTGPEVVRPERQSVSDDRSLPWRHQQPQQHIPGAEADRAANNKQGDDHVVSESVDGRTRSYVHREDHITDSRAERSCNFQGGNDSVRDGSTRQRQSDIHDLDSARWLDCRQSDLQRKLKYQGEFSDRNADRGAVDSRDGSNNR